MRKRERERVDWPKKLVTGPAALWITGCAYKALSAIFNRMQTITRQEINGSREKCSRVAVPAQNSEKNPRKKKKKHLALARPSRHIIETTPNRRAAGNLARLNFYIFTRHV
jgi:hypothetical protein